jgi:hypothetical protein
MTDQVPGQFPGPVPPQPGSHLYPSPSDFPAPEAPTGSPYQTQSPYQAQSPYRQQRGRRWRRKHSLGCLGSLVVLAILVVGLQVLITPWAFHLGGSFTPSMSWTGVAEGTAPHGGGRYAVQIKIVANTLSEHACSQDGCDDLHGSASVCTATGEFGFRNVTGKVGGWSSVDGQKMSLGITHGTNTADRNMQFELTGTWHGAAYQANDEGFLVRGFDAAGRPRPEVSPELQSNAVALTFEPGDFGSLCAKIKK